MLLHWVQLALTDGLGPILVKRIVETLGSAQAACEATISQLRTVEGIGTTKSNKIHESLQQARALAEQEIEAATGLGVTLISPEDDRYPTLLNDIPDPPPVLYVKGGFEPRDLNAIAIVGSRRPSYYGREQADRFGALLAGAGFTVISGGARGIDSAAHRGALTHPQGRTIAVLGCGIDIVYPPENTELFEQIARKGAVVTEHPLGTPPVAENFPRRNRIISGMSRGVLVVEADERSGALVTARQAIEDHNRPVFAIPGKIDNTMSAGPHKLIREGAVLTRGLEDILEGLGPLPHSATEPGAPAASDTLSSSTTLFDLPDARGGNTGASAGDRAPAPDHRIDAGRSTPAGPPLTDSQKKILDAMGTDPVTIDQLIDRTDLPASQILNAMTLLSLKGLVKRVEGQTYVKKG